MLWAAINHLKKDVEENGWKNVGKQEKDQEIGTFLLLLAWFCLFRGTPFSFSMKNVVDQRRFCTFTTFICIKAKYGNIFIICVHRKRRLRRSLIYLNAKVKLQLF